MTAWIFADAGSTTLAAPFPPRPRRARPRRGASTSTTGSPPLPVITTGQQYGATVLPPGGDTNPEVVVVTEVLNGTQVVVLRGMGTNGVVKTHSIGDTFTNSMPGGFLNGAGSYLPLAGGTMTGPIVGFEDKGGQVFNVKAYGATGNGTTPDTAAIQAAITAAGVGSQVWFPAGLTFLADSLVPLSGQTWAGGGTIKRSAASTVSIIATAASVTGFTLANLTIDANSANTNNQNTGIIHLLQPVQCIITGCTLKNAPSTTSMVTLRGGVECKVTGNSFASNGYHLIVGQLEGDTAFQTLRNVVANNTFDTSAKDSVFLTDNYGSVGGAVNGNCIGNVVANNTLVAPGDGAIEVGSGTVSTVVTGNTIIASAATNVGVYVRDSVDATITNNVMRGFSNGSGSYGVLGLNLNGVLTAIEVSGNTIRGAGGGIFFQATGATDIAILNNKIANTTSVQGIAVAYAAGVKIEGNTVAASASSGIYLGEFSVASTGVIDAIVSGNRVLNSAQHGIGIYENCTRVLVTGNRIYDNQGSQTQDYAVQVQDAAATEITITGNDFTLWGTGAIPINNAGGSTSVVVYSNAPNSNVVAVTTLGVETTLTASAVTTLLTTGTLQPGLYEVTTTLQLESTNPSTNISIDYALQLGTASGTIAGPGGGTLANAADNYTFPSGALVNTVTITAAGTLLLQYYSSSVLVVAKIAGAGHTFGVPTAISVRCL